MSLSRLSLGYKLAVTLVLINLLLGLLFAHVQLRNTIQNKDGEEGLSVVDVRYFFSGDPTKRILQASMNNPTHWSLTTAAEKEAIDDWIAAGAPSATYETQVAPILDGKCVRCHQAGGQRSVSPLGAYDEVRPYTELADTGVDYLRLAQLSLIGILAMVFAAVIVVGLFYATRFRGGWKDLFAFLPFVAILGNVLSWWSAKQSTTWVHIIIGSALVYGILVVVMVAVVLADTWILPAEERRGRRRRRVEDR